MTKSDHFRVRVYDNSNSTAYFELRDFPRENSQGCVGRTVMVHQLPGEEYAGPSINLDFDHKGRPIGIEILYSFDDED